MKTLVLYAFSILTFSILVSPCLAGQFQSDSKCFGNPKMDIVISEVERNP